MIIFILNIYVFYLKKIVLFIIWMNFIVIYVITEQN